ncbi:hypothetical protein K474DRAFT_1130302 [Panus rudis PR-1116 ss-1]|nr:hypothetical protein K474DRAFT_1130302 [Panus rudis PR-1116 ss-1]
MGLILTGAVTCSPSISRHMTRINQFPPSFCRIFALNVDECKASLTCMRPQKLQISGSNSYCLPRGSQANTINSTDLPTMGVCTLHAPAKGQRYACIVPGGPYTFEPAFR